MPLDPTQGPPYYEIVDPPEPVIQPLKYKATITQTGTSAPTATVLQNTFTGTPTYGYDSVGTYRITLTGAFTVNKTFINITNPGFYIVGGGRNDANSCYISSWDNAGTPTNDIFIEQGIEIEVWP